MVAQYFEVQVYDQFAIRGNAAIFKCQVPSFVADHVDVVSWIDSNGGSYVADGQSYGTKLKTNISSRTQYSPSVAGRRRIDPSSMGAQITEPGRTGSRLSIVLGPRHTFFTLLSVPMRIVLVVSGLGALAQRKKCMPGKQKYRSLARSRCDARYLFIECM